MKQLITFMLLSFLTTISFSAFAQQPSLEGTWLLKEVKYKTQSKNERSVLSEEKILEEQYYTCPSKITFEGQSACMLYYDNKEEKQAIYYIMPEGSSIYFSIPNETAIPERAFFLDWNRDEQSFLQLQYVGQGKQYIYNYQLQK